MSQIYTQDPDGRLIVPYTLSVFSENNAGLLNKISQILNRRKINIESLTTSESEIPGVHRFTIVIETHEDEAKKIVNQIEKIIDVLKAFYHVPEDTIYQEIAMYKLKTDKASSTKVEQIIRNHHARILTVDPAYYVIEKTGHKEETQQLLNDLQPYGVLEFARSGRIAITKPMKKLSEYLTELEILN